MGFDALLNAISLLFLLFLAFLIYKNRKNVSIEGVFIMWRTKLGLKIMDAIAKKIRKNKIALNSLLITMLVTTVVSFVFIVYYLIEHTIKLIVGQTNVPAVSLVIPGVTSIGGIKIPFWTILIIFIVAAVHEFGHGLLARIWKMKIKSTGLVLLAIIPGAFVEIDEKELEKRPLKEKLSVLAAGPFFNIILAILTFGLIFLVSSIPVTYEGIYFKSYNNSNLTNGTLMMINNKPLIYSNIYEVTKMIQKEIQNKSEVKLFIKQNNTVIEREVPVLKVNNQSKLGVYLYTNCNLALNKDVCQAKENINTFLMYLFIFNLGIGLANLLPLIPLDGGKMVYFLIGRWRKVFIAINIITLLILLYNLLYPLISKVNSFFKL